MKLVYFMLNIMSPSSFFLVFYKFEYDFYLIIFIIIIIIIIIISR
jgi:hypothetical protein